ncbi:hypothetical protein HDV06_002816 [Boothiomyces sp. JEL0866]|nr:hypothetical protein HDV06_002816 [Boothiomyces sp. JEL0866]
MEIFPGVMVLYALTAIELPLVAALCGSIYIAGRASFYKGYITGDPAKRKAGSFGHLGSLGLFISSIYVAAKLFLQ